MSLNKLVLLILLASTIYGCSTTPEKDAVVDVKVTGSLIDVGTLQLIKETDSVKIIDLRKAAEYLENHIPGAINIWRTDIENDQLPYDGIIAPKEKMEQLLSNLGIQNTDFVVIYDNNASCDAARLWWVLDHYGFTRAALLNGGLKAWSKVAELTTELPSYSPSSFSFPEHQPTNHVVLQADLLTEMQDSSIVIIDARSIEEYRGDYIKKGAYEKGRIPGSIHIDWIKSMNFQEQTFKTNQELKILFEKYGVTSDTKVVTYCHSGVRSAHTLFVLTQLLGYKAIRNYDGSWVEWSYNKLPFERTN